MGGKASKQQQQQFERSTSIRRTQKQQFRHIKQKCDQINKNLKKLKPKTQTEEQYTSIKNTIMEVRFLLQNISPELINKNKPLFDSCVTKCDEYNKILNFKFDKRESQETIYAGPTTITPSNTPAVTPQPVEVKVVQLAVNSDENVEVEKKKVMKKRKHDKLTRKISKDEMSFNEIHELRRKMVPLRDEILVFKGQTHDRTYHYLEESLLRCIQQLENIEVYDLQQIKHERKVAIDYAKESIDILRDIADGKYTHKVASNDIKKVELDSDESSDSFTFTTNLQPKIDDEEEINDFKKLLEQKLNANKRATMGMVKSKYEAMDEAIDGKARIQISKSIEITEMDGDVSEDTYDDTSTDDDLDDYTLEGLDVADDAAFKVTKI